MWYRTNLAIICSVLALLGGCDSQKTKSEVPASSVEPVQTTAIAQQTVMVDAALIPIEALHDLGNISLQATPRCARSFAALVPVFAQIRATESLWRSTNLTVSEASVALVTLSKALGDTAPELQLSLEANDGKEVARIHSELVSAVGDMSESLQRAGQVLKTGSAAAAAANMRRMRNGVTNTRSSIEGLIALCM